MKAIWILIITLLLFSCKDEKNRELKESAGHEGMKDMASGNKNLPVDEKGLTLSDQQIQLANIQTDTIKSGMLGDRIVLTGTLTVDETKTTSISARVMGRIEKLYFKNEGDYVKKGDRIYDLYSEELNNAKQELILALEQKNKLDNSLIDFNQIVTSSQYKLLLWGMSKSQINQLVKTRKATSTTPFYSAVSGYINTLELIEGDYTMEGGTIMKLSDLSSIWAEAQIYTSQLSQINTNAAVQVEIPDVSDRSITGKIEFVNPEVVTNTRTNLLRVNIANPDNKLKPGMVAYVILKNSQHSMLSLPIDAVIRDGKGATVWIQTGKNTYKSKMVETGMETGNLIEIKSGLKAGDIVVLTGAYLINSEFIFQNGANPMDGMKM
ncbi:efflux RND transporter periplasmic adaptor subunit [Pedobacter sp. JCM 36344]|uniref:efflux RND transporter periplasmic adaptor subunit n=1 Tax=Pedobacter sp. JCM 36344 TaxID=3374280 RepID=UPI00397B7FA5